MEVWKTVKDYKYFEVSNYGRVRETLTKLIITQWDNGRGYLRITVPSNDVAKGNTRGKRNYYNEDGKRLKIMLEYVHRLVAMAFIPNPENKPLVDHIDTDRANNMVDNLRWVTQSENNLNPITRVNMINSSPLSKKVRCIETGQIYISTCEVQRHFSKTGIRAVMSGKSKTYCGYHWEYIE